MKSQSRFPSSPHAWFALVVVALVITVAYVLAPPALWAEGLYLSVPVLAITAIVVGLRVHRPADVFAWLAIAAGNMFFLFGELTWIGLDIAGLEPFPSVADYFYLAGYPLIAVGLFRLIKRHSPVRDVFGALDTAIVAVAAALLSWVYLMEPYATDPTLTMQEKLWTLAYPSMSLLLAAAAVRLLFGVRVRTASNVMLTGAVVIQLGADAVYGWQELQGIYEVGGLLDGSWMIAYMLFGAAALHPSIATEPIVESDRFRVGRGRLFALGLAALIPPAVLIALVLGSEDPANTHMVAAAGASAVVFLLSLARMWGLVGTVRSLVEHRGEQRFAAMVEHSKDVIAVLDADLTVTYVSPSISSWGRSMEDCLGRSVEDLDFSAGDASMASMVHRAMTLSPGAVVEFEGTVNWLGGSSRNFEAVAANLVHDPKVGGIVLTMRDTTQQRELEHQLTHQAFHDSLTGLANRALFIDRLEVALAKRSRSPQDEISVLFVDLDDFKSVNDGLGHSAGDDLLASVAERLASCLRAGDTAARLGGDEFAILLDDGGHDQAVSVAQRMLDALCLPLSVGDLELSVPASIGLVTAPPRATAQSLLQDADIAMYEAKGKGKGRFEIFHPSMRTTVSERLQLKTDIADALELGQFHLAYQPIIDIASEAITGAEALLRWNHPQRGNVPPADFIPLAEQSGLIVPIGRWVLQEACREAAKWNHSGQRLSVSVNASGVQFKDNGLIADAGMALADSGLPAELLTLEITETVLMEDTDQTTAVLSELADLGVRIAIDDFGTGYCSLAYLQKFPIDVIKIDRAFVAELTDVEPRGETLASSILGLVQTLGLVSVAEGVEQLGQLNQLRHLDCDLVQGFHFSRPVSPTRFRELLGERTAIAR